jgi:hypothetical protein
MKRNLILAAVSILFAGGLFAENVAYSSLTPKTAKSMALGGVFTSIPTSEFSFFGNPAGFASAKAAVLAPSVDVWGYAQPSSDNIANALDNAGSKDEFLPELFKLMAENGGSGGGASLGFGYAGRGLGIGFFSTTDLYLEGTNPASAIVHSDSEVTAIIGLGMPFKLGSLKLNMGGDFRPFYRISLHGEDHAELALADILAAMDDPNGSLEDSIYADAFFGAAMDFGVTAQLGTLTAGLSIRDIAPSFPVASDSWTNLSDTLSSGQMPDTTDSTITAVLTPNITAGLSWTPRVLPSLVEPALYFELQDIVSVIKDGSSAASAFNLVHVGAEVELLNFFTLRGGLNRGWFSLGAGIRFFFFDLDAAVFTEELGSLPGDEPRSGLAVHAALRF